MISIIELVDRVIKIAIIIIFHMFKKVEKSINNHFFRILFIYFREGEGREKERERNNTVWFPLVHPHMGTWPATQACALTGN